MAQQKDLYLIELKAISSGMGKLAKELRIQRKETQAVETSTEAATRANDKFSRGLKGTAEMSSNATKNFSKMQQGAGGFVRAYALLAANVFAITAAFGVLSRSAQIDKLTESMKILSTEGGQDIRNLSEALVEASGNAIALDQAFRQVSLASSAGLSTDEIEGLTKVARGAAISLGRDLPDALDRIFRGAIKLEPEILDEIGLFVRVDEASRKYAQTLGRAVTSLSQAEKRQAFLNEILEQGEKKFSEYADSIQPDAFVRLAASFRDLAQDATSLANMVIGPLVGLLADNKGLLAGAFLLVAGSLINAAIPALGEFTTGLTDSAKEAQKNAQDFAKDQQLKVNAAIAAEQAIQNEIKESAQAEADRKRAQLDVTPKFRSQAKAAEEIDENLKLELKGKERIAVLDQRINLLTEAKEKSQKKSVNIINKELRALKAEKAELDKIEKANEDILALENKQLSAKKGKLAQLRAEKLENRVGLSEAASDAVSVAEFEGIGKGFEKLNKGFNELDLKGKTGLSQKLSKSFFYMRGAVGVLAVGFQELMMKMGPYIALFTAIVTVSTLLFKKFADGVEEATKLKDQLETLKNTSKELEERFEKQVKKSKNVALNFLDQAKGAEAFSTAQAETSSELLKSIEILEEFEAAAGGAMNMWQGFKSLWGGDLKSQTLDELERSSSILLKGLVTDGQNKRVEELAGLLDPSGKLGKSVKAYGDSLEESGEAQEYFNQLQETNPKLYDKLMTRTNNLTTGYKKMAASNDGASEATRLFINRHVNAIKTTKKLSDEVNNIGADTDEYRKALELNNEVEATRAARLKATRSAFQGAGEAVGKFQQNFLPKTKVDEIVGGLDSVISTVSAMTKEIEMNDGSMRTVFNEQEAVDFFNVIAKGENDLSQLFSAKQRKQLEDFVKAGNLEGAQVLVQGVTDNYKEYQASILTAATAIKTLTEEQKNLNTALKLGVDTSGRIAEIRKKTADDNVKIARLELEILGSQRSIDKASIQGEADKLKISLANNELAKNTLITSGQLTETQALQIINANEILEQKQRQANIEKRLVELGIQADKDSLAAAQALFKITKARAEAEIKLAEAQAKQRGLTFAGGTGNAEQLAIQTAQRKAQIEAESVALQSQMQEIELRILAAKLDVLAKEKGLDSDEGKRLDALSKGITGPGGLISKIEDTLKDALLTNATTFANATAQKLKDTDLSTAAGVLAFSQNSPEQQIKDLEQQKKDNPDMTDEQVDAINRQIEALNELDTTYLRVQATVNGYAESLKKLGPEGEYYAAVSQGILGITDGYANLKATLETAEGATEKFAAVSAFASETIGTIGNIMAANSKSQVAEIDNQIKAEQNRDGKSAESVAKIKQLEKKKEAIQKKAFEQNKKIQLAQAVINGLSAIQSGFATQPFFPLGLAMGALAIGMTAMQISAIKKQQYQGGASEVSRPNTNLQIGKRGSAVDVAKNTTAGELNYLRAGRTTGQNIGGAGNLPGGAMGRKGYAMGGEGIVVGERGPEVITPTAPVDITPNFALGGGTSNVNFTINAVDAAGVEDVLMNQRGNIIRMIREAANDHGEQFLEDVDTQTYGGRI